MRSRLAAAAFDSTEHTQLLNSITHPAIMDECFRRVDMLEEAHDIVVVEVTSGEMTREAFLRPMRLCGERCPKKCVLLARALGADRANPMFVRVWRSGQVMSSGRPLLIT